MVYVYDVTRRVVFQELQDGVVLLSPSLYWYKSCSIPTKNLIKAKNIAKHMMSDRPSRFSEIVLYRIDNHYDAYAYDKSFVKSLLKELNLKNPKVYFANQLHIEDVVSIDEEFMLYSFGGRVMQGRGFKEVRPEQVRGSEGFEEVRGFVKLADCYRELLAKEMPIKEFLRSDRNESKLLLALVAFVAVFVVLYGVDKMMVLANIQKSEAALSSNANSSVSFYEMQSLIKRYEAQDKRATKLKMELNRALGDGEIESLIYEDGAVKYEK